MRDLPSRDVNLNKSDQQEKTVRLIQLCHRAYDWAASSPKAARTRALRWQLFSARNGF